MSRTTALLTLSACIALSQSLSAMGPKTSELLAVINGIALSESADTLKQAREQHQNLDLNQQSICHGGFFWTCSEPMIEGSTRLASPLWWATQSDRDPVEKIAYLKEQGANLTVEDDTHHLNPFWAAIERHEKEGSTLSRHVVIAMLSHYPEAYAQRDPSGSSVLARAAQTVDPELVSHILYAITPERDDLGTALEATNQATYTYQWSSWLRLAEDLGPAGIFISHQKACQALLEKALESYKKED